MRAFCTLSKLTFDVHGPTLQEISLRASALTAASGSEDCGCADVIRLPAAPPPGITDAGSDESVTWRARLLRPWTAPDECPVGSDEVQGTPSAAAPPCPPPSLRPCLPAGRFVRHSPTIHTQGTNRAIQTRVKWSRPGGNGNMRQRLRPPVSCVFSRRNKRGRNEQSCGADCRLGLARNAEPCFQRDRREKGG